MGFDCAKILDECSVPYQSYQRRRRRNALFQRLAPVLLIASSLSSLNPNRRSARDFSSPLMNLTNSLRSDLAKAKDARNRAIEQDKRNNEKRKQALEELKRNSLVGLLHVHIGENFLVERVSMLIASSGCAGNVEPRLGAALVKVEIHVGTINFEVQRSAEADRCEDQGARCSICCQQFAEV